MTLGTTIRAARKSRGLTLAQVGKKLGVTESFLSDIERGIRVPTAERLEQLGDVLDLDVADLRAQAGRLSADELSYIAENVSVLRLVRAMMIAGFGAAETERLIRQVERTGKR